MRAQYKLADTAVEVCWDVPALGPAVRGALQHLGLEGTDSQVEKPPLAVNVSAVNSPPCVPDEAEKVFDLEEELTIYRTKARVFLESHAAVAQVNPTTGFARLELPSQVLEPASMLRGVLFSMLAMNFFVLLRHRQFYPLHAAALVADGTGVLLVANQDCGKSTLAYSLARQGWAFLSDDSVLLHPNGAMIEVVAFRRRFTMDAEAREFFPEMASAWKPLFGNEAKGAVSMEALYPGQATDCCVPKALVFPEIAERPDSQLLSVRKSEAMHNVLGQSALVTLQPDVAPQHIEATRRLVLQTRHYRLIAGHDLKSDPPRVERLLEQTLHEEPSLPAST